MRSIYKWLTKAYADSPDELRLPANFFWPLILAVSLAIPLANIVVYLARGPSNPVIDVATFVLSLFGFVALYLFKKGHYNGSLMVVVSQVLLHLLIHRLSMGNNGVQFLSNDCLKLTIALSIWGIFSYRSTQKSMVMLCAVLCISPSLFYAIHSMRTDQQYTIPMIITPLMLTAIVLLGVYNGRRQFNSLLESARERQIEKFEAEEASRTKSMFLANMSHEIRTPMNAILGLAHLLGKTSLLGHQKEYLDKLRNSAQALLGILNDILDFSKIEAGRLELESVAFDLDETVQGVVDILAHQAQSKALAFELRMIAGLHGHLVGDPLRLSQILLNLGSNAIKFTSRGDVTLSASLLESSPVGARILFEVRDTGIGMNPKQLQKIFNAFEQADLSTTRNYGGTGLGLPISKALVEKMGGSLEVQSDLGRGSKFSFTLNFPVIARQENVEATELVRLQDQKVLVVDDQPSSLLTLSEYLGSWQMRVTQISDSTRVVPEILAAITANDPYDVILLDWKMPGLDGIQVLQQLQGENIKLPAILMVTAYDREQLDPVQLEELGVGSILSKPVSPQRLLQGVTNVLAKAKDIPLTIPVVVEASASKAILIVDDNEINRLVISEVLIDLGYTCDLAVNGKEGVELYSAAPERYGLILMDLQMPVMDGLQASRILRSKYPSTVLPIIGLTADARKETIQLLVESGMNDCLTKPIDPVILANRIRQELS